MLVRMVFTAQVLTSEVPEAFELKVRASRYLTAKLTMQDNRLSIETRRSTNPSAARTDSLREYAARAIPDPVSGARVVHPKHLAPTLAEWAAAHREAMQALAEQTYSAFLWRYTSRGGSSLSAGRLEFELDGTWCPVTQPTVWMSHSLGPRMNVTSETLSEFLEQDLLAYQVLWAAQRLMLNEPRASLLLSVSAVEIGAKRLISELSPDSAWLLKESQSLPVVRLLGEYLPSLRSAYAVPRPLLAKLEKVVAHRNQCAHAGARVTSHQAHAAWVLSNRILRSLDVSSGFDWASRLADLRPFSASREYEG